MALVQIVFSDFLHYRAVCRPLAKLPLIGTQIYLSLFFLPNFFINYPYLSPNNCVMRVVIRCCLFTVLLAAAATAAAQTSQMYYKDGSDKFMTGDYRGAIEAFTKAIGMEPAYTDAWYFRGMTKFIMKDSTAADDFSKTVGLDPNRVKAWAYRGMARYRRKEYSSAIADFSRAISLKPDYEEAWFYRGNSNMELKNYFSAITDLDKAIALKPDYTAAIYTRGVARFMMQKYAEALPDLDRTIALNPTYSGKTWYFRGICRIRLNQKDMACPDFKKAAELGVADAAEMRKKYCQ